MTRLFYLAILSFVLGACSTTHVLVKFKNTTSEDFKSLKVRILGNEFYFDSLKSGQTTKYISVKGTYHYCYAMAVTSKDTIVCQPIDFVGEKLFQHGKLIMRLSIYDSPGGKRFLDVSSR